MNISIKKFNDLLELDNLIFIYKGVVSQDILAIIAKNIRDDSEESFIISKRLFSIIIEIAHNIHHYSSKKEYSRKENKNIGNGIIAISNLEDYYLIHAGNYVSIQNAEWLINECTHINSLNQEELKNYYKKCINEGCFNNEKEGGSIGLIDIKKKSGNTLESHIIKPDNDNYFFSLIVKVQKNDTKIKY